MLLQDLLHDTSSPLGSPSSPIGSPSSPIGSPILLHNVKNLLYEVIIHLITKKIESKLDGTIFFID